MSAKFVIQAMPGDDANKTWQVFLPANIEDAWENPDIFTGKYPEIVNKRLRESWREDTWPKTENSREWSSFQWFQ